MISKKETKGAMSVHSSCVRFRPGSSLECLMKLVAHALIEHPSRDASSQAQCSRRHPQGQPIATNPRGERG